MKIELCCAIALCIASFSASAQASPDNYAEGQVWEYKARPQDAGSLLKIQRITMVGEYFVCHVSIIGVHFAKPNVAGILPHVPVSPQTLDQSVTKLSSSTGPFPPITAVDEGIAEWQRAQGGVFTIPVSQIVDIADQQLNKADPSH